MLAVSFGTTTGAFITMVMKVLTELVKILYDKNKNIFRSLMKSKKNKKEQNKR